MIVNFFKSFVIEAFLVAFCIPPTVNFINILPTNFSYESALRSFSLVFSSYFLDLKLKIKLLEALMYEKLSRKMLTKLTLGMRRNTYPTCLY